MSTEMMIAAAISLAMLAAALGLVDPARGALVVQPQIAEMDQRLRGAAAQVRADLVMAGSGPHPLATTSLASLRAPVVPAIVGHRYPSTSGARFTSDAVTLFSVPPGRTPAQLASPLTGRSSVVPLVPDLRRCPGLRRPRPTCGFEQNALSLAFDATGRTDIFRVLDVDATTVRLRAVAGGVPLSFAAGDFLVPLLMRSYYLDQSAAQLRVYDGWASDAPMVNDVVGFTVRYFGRPDFPLVEPGRWPVARCLAGAASLSTRSSPTDKELLASVLTDGPWCGGRLIFDADLFRVSRVRIELRLQVADSGLRGRDRRWFVNPGDGRPGRVIPDLTGVIEVSPRQAGAF